MQKRKQKASMRPCVGNLKGSTFAFTDLMTDTNQGSSNWLADCGSTDTYGPNDAVQPAGAHGSASYQWADRSTWAPQISGVTETDGSCVLTFFCYDFLIPGRGTPLNRHPRGPGFLVVSRSDLGSALISSPPSPLVCASSLRCGLLYFI